MSKIVKRGSSGFSSLLENELFSDIVIIAVDGDNFKDIPAHKCVLAAGSSFFMTLLEADPKMDSVHLNERYDVVMAG